MRHYELLLTLSEISVTIAALSAVAGVVKSGASTHISSRLLRDVAVIGMTVALFAFLPLIFWEEASNCSLRLIALGAAVTWFSGYVLYLKGVLGDRKQITSAFWIGLLITIGGITLFLFVAMSDTQYAVRAYLMALLAWLAIGGLNFVVSVFWISGTDDA